MKKKKWTVMFLSLNQTEKTFFIQNVGYTEDDFIKLFKLTQEQVEIFNRTYFNGFEKDISDNEFKALLQYCVTNMDVIGVYRINNFYNRDQKVINDMKDNVRAFWIGKGYKEVIHCESPIIDTHGGTVFNKRDYLYLIEERIREEEEELKYFEDKINETEKEYKDRIIQIEKEYELKEQNLNKELEKSRIELEETIKNNTAKIKQQNWYIDKTKEAENEYILAKEKLDKEIERYKKGKEYNDNMFKSLPIEIQNMIDKRKSITEEIDKLNKLLNTLDNDMKKLEDEINKEKINYINLKKTEYQNLINDIKKVIENKNWTKEEALNRFINTCKMYLLNKRNVPQFEKENAISEGLTENEIAEILQKYKF